MDSSDTDKISEIKLARSQSKLQYNQDQIINGYRIEVPISQTETFIIFRCDKDNQKYALKIFSQSTKQIQEKLIQLYTELKKLVHSNIVRIYDNFFYKDRLCVVMQYCSGGDLAQYIIQSPMKYLSENDALIVFRKIVLAVNEMHKFNFIHRNICLENIIFQDGIPLLCGLDNSNVFEEEQQLFLSMCTCLESAAPEMLSQIIYNYKVDIWSLGVILWQMIYGQPPFGSHINNKDQLKSIYKVCRNDLFFFDEVIDAMEKDMFPNGQLPKISQDTYQIFQKIFQINPDNRIDFIGLGKMKAVQVKLLQDPNTPKMQGLSKVEKNDEDDQQLAIYTKNFRSLQQLNTVIISDTQISNKIYVDKKSCLLASTALSEQLNNYFEQDPNHIQFSTHLQLILFNMARYQILADNYQVFNISYEFPIALGGESKVYLMKYYLLRIILYIIKRLHAVLNEKKNVFEVKRFEEFANTEMYRILTKQVLEDQNKWDAEYIKIYQKVKQIITLDKFPEDILQGIQREITIDYKADYFNLPDMYKLPSRAVFLTIFGKMYQKAQRFLRYEELPPPQLKDVEIKKYQQKEGKKHIRLALRLLICASIYRIYNPKNQKFYLKHFNYEDTFFLSNFFQWEHSILVKNAEEEILNIFQLFYKNIDLRNVNSYTYF